MKIAIIDTTIGGNLIGGAQTFLPALLEGFRETGNELHLITNGPPNERVRKQIESSKIILHTNLWNGLGFVEENAPILANWLNNLAPDIYLISVSSDIGWVVVPLLNPNIAILTIGHTDSDTFYFPARHYRNFLTRIIGVSPEICHNYVINCGINNEKVEWIPYGVQASKTEPRDNGDNILKIIYVGRLEEEQKRVSDLVKTIKLLSMINVNFKFTIVGDGEEMPKIKKNLFEELNTGKVILLGWLESEQVIKAMRSSEVFVLTSAYEGFCIALVEAMANGCCPVVTNIESGNKKLIKNEETGFLLPIGDIETFGEKLKFLSMNRAKLLEFRQKAWITGGNYSLSKMINAYQSCFQQAVKSARINPRSVCTEFPLMETCRSKYPLWLRKIKARVRQFISEV